MVMQSRRSTGLKCAYAVIIFSFAFSFVSAQTTEDEPNDARDWGRASQYQSVSQLGDTPIATFPIPILFGVELVYISQNFGDPRGDGTRLHEGLDIMAPGGTPIASPTDAVVTRTGNGANSGQYVRTANPGGEQFVYMHLSEIAKGITSGSVVKRGEILGFVGNTGNASGGAAHLHFEIRKNGAQDPFSRLSSTFTLQERMTGAAQSLERTTDAGKASMLATQFKTTFQAAHTMGITVPSQIASLLPSQSANPTPTPTTPPLGKNALLYRETNADISAMQRVLSENATGVSGVRLKNTGATGYFGPVTKAALIKYQTAQGLVAHGLVDDATFAKLFGGVSVTPSISPVSDTFSRDLEIGMSGSDVRALQVFLNTSGFVITNSGIGSPGSESDFFGSLTRAALIKYQSAHNIAPAAGYFGPKTRSLVIRS